MQALGPSPGDEVTLYNVDPSLPKAARTQSGGRRAPRSLRAASSKFIPVFVAVGGAYLSVVTRSKATHVLVHVEYDTSTWYGLTMLNVGQGSVRLYSQRLGDVRLYYLDVNTNVDTLPPEIRQAVSAAYSQVDGYDFTKNNKAQMIRRLFATKPRAAPELKDVEPGLFDRAAVSGEHHTHLRPEEIWDIAKRDPARRELFSVMLENLKTMGGVTEAFASSALLYAVIAGLTQARIVVFSSYLWTDDLGTTMDRLKDVSVKMKALHSRDILDLTELFELNTLVNRGYGAVNWKTEREHRLNPDVIDVKPETVYAKAVSVFNMGVRHGFKYKRMNLRDFAAARWEWSPAGSVHSQHAVDEKYINRDSYRYRTKFVTLNSMPLEHVERMFTRKPAIRAWASTKYEWGKERAIYGVDLTSATVAHFAMFNCEEVLKHRFPVGEDAEAGRVHKRLKAMLEGCDSFCYDFDDFNAQHSTSSMLAVIKAYRDVFAPAMTEEQLAAMNWILDSYMDIMVYPLQDGPYRPNGTLLSGSRLTTFINTVLNYVYMDIAGVFEHPDVVDSVHNGDDVLIAIRSVKAAIDVHDKMADINARAQPAKCNILSVGEFLRVEHKIEMSDGLGSQYLSRACATAVHSRIESQMPVRALDAVSATVTRMGELKRRAPAASEQIDLLTIKIFKHLSIVFSTPYDKLAAAASAHSVVGGCSDDRWAPVEWKVREVIPYHLREDEESSSIEQAVVPGCRDYAALMERRLNGVIPFNKIHQSVSRATRAQLAITRESKLVLDDVSAQVKYKYARALKGMYKGIVKLPFIARARFLGLPPIALASQAQISKLMRLTSSVSDVAWTLKVLL